MGQFESSSPIYLQIVEKICYKIAREELSPGNKLLSVREMAIEMGVNPNTIQRTYSELERMGIVETKRGQGTFICNDKQIVDDLKQSLQGKVIETFISKMKQLGATELEIVSSVKSYIESNRGEVQ